MKTIFTALLLLVASFSSACTDRAKEAEKVKQDAAAKARAEAAKKEMNALPKVFSTPDYFKKNEPAKPAASSPSTTETSKK